MCLLCLAINISGNVSIYPGETATFICKVETQGMNVTFQWVRTNGTTVMFFNETLDVEARGVGSTQNYSDFNSTFSVTNVNYTNNNAGYYCNVSDCNTSMTAYLTGNCE